LGLASIVHGPGVIVAYTKLAPDTCTTFGGGRMNVQRPESVDGDAFTGPAQQTPANANDNAVPEIASVRSIPRF
jgi:hypothetical protein